MATIDTSIYMQRQSPNILGKMQQGMALRDAMDQRALAQKQLAEQEQIKKAYAEGAQIGDDGQVSFDPNRTIGALAKAGLGHEAYEFQNKHQQQEMQRQKQELELSGLNYQKQIQELDTTARLIHSVDSPEGYAQAITAADGMGLDTTQFRNMPFQEFMAIKPALLGRALSQKEHLEQQHRDRTFGLQQRELGIKEREAKAKLAGGASRPLTKFEQAAEQERGKAYGRVQAGAVQANQQLVLIDDALRELEKYGENTLAGTGWAARFKNKFGSFAPETQNLEAKFRLINIKNMAQTFEGMSRAVDSEVERAAWEATQANIGLDDHVNKNILLGAKAVALKAKAEAEAQKQWVEGMGRGTLQGYDSPVLGKTSAMVAPNGEMILVEKGMEREAEKEGYVGIDEYARGGQPKMEVAPMRRKTNQIDWMD